MVVAVGCTVLQMWRGGVPWALQVRVLRAPAVAGHVAIPDPPGQSAGVRTKEVRGSRGGPRPLEEGGPGPRPLVLGIPPRGGAWRHRTPPRAGGGSGAIRVMRWSPVGRSWRNCARIVPSASSPASQFSQCCHSVRDGGAVTGVGGWDSGHSHCGEWRSDAVCPKHCGGVVGT